MVYPAFFHSFVGNGGEAQWWTFDSGLLPVFKMEIFIVLGAVNAEGLYIGVAFRSI